MKHLFLILALMPQFLAAQQFDNSWLIGYNNDADTNNLKGIQLITFDNGNIHIRQNPALYQFNFQQTNTALSDSSGRILSYTNGVHIGNAAWQVMENGDTITDASVGLGEVYTQWVLMLPWPSKPNLQLFLYEKDSFTVPLSVHATKLRFGIIDLAANAGKGRVVLRDSILITDTLALGKLDAVKHANGRDWWVLVNERNTNRFYRILITPEGPTLVGRQSIGAEVLDGVGQAAFSPDGTHYFSFNIIGDVGGTVINLYDFDRCEGRLSNPRTYQFLPWKWGGAAFSPNSRYLYINYYTKAYQYDLEAPDVWASQVEIAEYDGYLDPSFTTFYTMQPAPDGKIYATYTNAANSFHVIQRPDEPGLACRYEQHAVSFSTRNSFSIPTFPNFRLGPVDGSACDSLGIDNRPVAWWRAERDTANPLLVYFHDLSYYEPQAWHWDFGDGSPGVSERHPEHVFPGPGDYQVCLTVSNTQAENTLCRTLKFTTSAVGNPQISSEVSVWPNPFGDYLSVALGISLRSPVLQLFDARGELLCTQALSVGITEVATQDLPGGLYFWEIRSAGDPVASGKLIRY